MAARRMVTRNERIIATKAAEIAATRRRRKAWRKRVSVMTGTSRRTSDLHAASVSGGASRGYCT